MVASKPFITGTLLAGLMVRFPISVPWRKEDGSIRPPCSPRRIIIAFLISFSLFMTAPAHGAALTVGPGGSIQAAINSAAGGRDGGGGGGGLSGEADRGIKGSPFWG